MLTYSEFEKFALSNYALEEKIVNVIDNSGRQLVIESVSQFLSYQGCTVKIQSMEKYNYKIYNKCRELAEQFIHKAPITCHAFRAYPDSVSFGVHTDPDDVYLLVAEGIKTIEVDGKYIHLNAGDSLFIPANTPHQAHNTHSSLMLSFGLEKFMIEKIDYELDVLSQNH
jgi:mannose-6-phosphate isomerase-like protein (cupin superfamily)